MATWNKSPAARLPILPALLCAAAWALPLGAAESPLHFVVLDPLALRNACPCVRGHAQRDYEELARRLEVALGRSVATVYGSHLPEQGEPLEIIIGKQSVIEAEAAARGLKLQKVARLTDKHGSTDLHGLFVVRSNDAARVLGDLRGRTVVFGKDDCAEKHAAALAALRGAGAPVAGELRTYETCAEAGVEVAEGRADAAVISSYALPLLEGCEEIAKGELRVIGRTADVPFIALYVAPGLPPGLRPALARALGAVARDELFCDAMESAKGFVPEDDAPEEGWTDWRGSGRACRSAHVPARLPKAPRFAWRKKLESQSLGGVAATESVVLVSDKSADGNEDVWHCLDAATGEARWTFRRPAPGQMDFTTAPRATPVIAGDAVILLGAFGHLTCVALADGAVRWQHDLRAEFRGALPKWGFCATPLVADDLVVVAAAAPTAMLAAFELGTGKLTWKAAGGQPGYGNFIRRDDQLIGFDSATAGGWDLRTGRRVWTLRPPLADAEFNVPTPVLFGGRLLLATEANGARLYAFDETGRPGPKPVAVREDANPTTTSPVVAGEVVWLANEGGLLCLDERLQPVWTDASDVFADPVNLIAGDRHVLALSQTGVLGLFPARPAPGDKPELLTLFPAQEREVEVWSQPALVGPRLYVRSDAEIACVLLAD